jgi:hypothetical protein
LARIAIGIGPPSSNHDKGLPVEFDSQPKVLRQVDDVGQKRVIASEAKQSRKPNSKCGLLRRYAPRNDETAGLPLPAANAAGLARPCLDSRIARLRIERVAAAMRQLGAGGAAWRFGAGLGHLRPDDSSLNASSLGDVNIARGKPGPNGSIRIGLRAIGPCFDGNRGELRFRPQPLRRKHGSGEIEPEELAGTILVRPRRTAQCQEPDTKYYRNGTFQDHSWPPETK